MRALVTGGAGFIGSHLVEALVARGDAVTVLDDFSTGHAENLAAVRADIRLVRGSVTEPADVAAAAAGADVIFHQAAVASVPRSVEEPAHTHAVNVGGTVQILDAARRLGVRRVILACSAAVYGDRSDAAREDDAPHPESPYAVEKLAAEHYLRMWPSIYGTETVSLRYFNVFGPRQDPASPYSGVVSVFVDRLRKGLPVTIYGDGEQTRDFVAVADVVRVATAGGIGSAIHANRHYRCVVAGTTAAVQPAYATTVGEETTDGSAVFEAEEAWSRSGLVTEVTDRASFTASIDEPRAIDGWFAGGVLTWETGANAGRSIEVKSWTQATGQLELFLPMGYAIEQGDAFRIHPGCDKRLDTCIDRFANVLNFRGEPYVPGQDLLMSIPDAR